LDERWIYFRWKDEYLLDERMNIFWMDIFWMKGWISFGWIYFGWIFFGKDGYFLDERWIYFGWKDGYLLDERMNIFWMRGWMYFASWYLLDERMNIFWMKGWIYFGWISFGWKDGYLLDERWIYFGWKDGYLLDEYLLDERMDIFWKTLLKTLAEMKRGWECVRVGNHTTLVSCSLMLSQHYHVLYKVKTLLKHSSNLYFVNLGLEMFPVVMRDSQHSSSSFDRGLSSPSVLSSYQPNYATTENHRSINKV
jgi:hypothetical protein